jgi:hypothetical protein
MVVLIEGLKRVNKRGYQRSQMQNDFNSSTITPTNRCSTKHLKPRITGRNQVSHVNIWKSNPRFFEVSETEDS